MSEILVKNPPNALIVSTIDPGSPAARAGIQPGDLLRSINDRAILDILDYQFHSADNRLNMQFEREGAPYNVQLRLREGQSAGIEFSQDLGDKIHTCVNKCVFCFIHQMPKKMRRSLYLMDDDFRLSFMHGNYVTLTNLSDEEWERIIEQRLSPLYVSVHATDPDLRAVLLGKKQPAPIIPALRRLHENRIDVHAQIVLCPGINDEDALDQTLEELAQLHPIESGLRCGVLSVAIVPVGLTRFRERLPKLATADRDYAREMIDVIAKQERKFNRRLETRFAWLSDEWYFLAGLPMPGRRHYEDFPQLEDGIGTVRLFLDEAEQIVRKLPASAPQAVSATLVTAELAAAVVTGFANALNQVEGVDINVCVIKNDFFGGVINIAGLLTATDIIAAVNQFPTKERVYIPAICLRDRNVFLDDLTIQDVAEQTGREIRVIDPKPRALAVDLGLAAEGRARGVTSEHWMMEPAGAAG
jgi:putative radical SAM enzyme (TIGR03279 family)